MATTRTMRLRHPTLLTALALMAATANSQSAPTAPLPNTEAAIPAWDLNIVRRAEALLASLGAWNRKDSEADCSPRATTFSLRCALETATAEAAGRVGADSGSGRPRPCPPACDKVGASLVTCHLRADAGLMQGNCGEFFDESTVFAVARAAAVRTGTWRADAQPSEVWAGRMTNAENPVLDESRRLVDEVAPRKNGEGRLFGFNNDSSTTFASIQDFLRKLESRMASLPPAKITESADSVEIELYASGSGVIRTYNGWYAVSGFATGATSLQFTVDTAHQVAANELDRKIIERADAILASDAVWNRADNRKCPASATTWSIYCALERATIEVTGGFHHRRPALEIVRLIVEERTNGRQYNHRLMDYNNDRTTTLADVRSLFREALAKAK
jgi:hypothetical protein